MVSAPARANAFVVEKYVNMRTQAFTRTHAKALQQWLDGGRGSEAEYFTEFKRRVEESRKQWERDCARIDADPATSFREKREEKNRLTRLYPAWTVENEEAFIRTYGDPHSNRGRLQAALDELQEDVWANALREGQPREVPKHEWEKKFYDALMNPQDGSVPVFQEAIILNPAVPEADAATEVSPLPSVAAPTFEIQDDPPKLEESKSEPKSGPKFPSRAYGYEPPALTPEIEIPAPVIANYMTEAEKARYQKWALDHVKKICPRCGEFFESGLKPQHVNSSKCRQTQEVKGLS